MRLELHRRKREQTSETITLGVDVGERRMADDARRPHRQSHRNHLTARLHRALEHPRDTRARPNLDALATELAPRALGERRMHAAQDLRAGLDDQQAIVARIDAAIARHDVGVEEVLQFRNKLHAGVAAAHHAQGQQPPARGRVGLVGGVLGEVDDVVAEQEDRVVEPLVAERVLRDAGNAKVGVMPPTAMMSGRNGRCPRS